MSAADADISAQPAPSEAPAVFGTNFAKAQHYAELLCSDGVLRGLIGPREPARIWTRHLLNGAALAPWIESGAKVVDVGSGAGLPGIPLLLARPDLDVTLLEPMARRASFCEQARDLLELDLTVVRSRAQDAPKGQADVVVARAVAPLERLLDLALPLLRPGGRLLALKGDRAADEVRSATSTLARARLGTPEVHSLGEGDDRTYVVAVTAPGKALR